MLAERSDASHPPSTTSYSLLDRVRQREPMAWQRFVRLYGPIVYQWSVTGGLQPSDAADVAQEVFVAVAGKLDRFRRERPDDSFRGWLYTVTRNKVRDHYRARRNEPAGVGGDTAQWQMNQLARLPEQPDNLPVGDTGDLARRVLNLIRSEFETSTWQAFWQSTVDGRSPTHVAQDLGLTLAAVYQAKYRVLKYLRREIEGLTP